MRSDKREIRARLYVIQFVILTEKFYKVNTEKSQALAVDSRRKGRQPFCKSSEGYDEAAAKSFPAKRENDKRHPVVVFRLPVY